MPRDSWKEDGYVTRMKLALEELSFLVVVLVKYWLKNSLNNHDHHFNSLEKWNDKSNHLHSLSKRSRYIF